MSSVVDFRHVSSTSTNTKKSQGENAPKPIQFPHFLPPFVFALLFSEIRAVFTPSRPAACLSNGFDFNTVSPSPLQYILRIYQFQKDENAYKRDESNASGVGPQELFPDGLTPPTKNVVRRRFLKARPDRRKFKRTEARFSFCLYVFCLSVYCVHVCVSSVWFEIYIPCLRRFVAVSLSLSVRNT